MHFEWSRVYIKKSQDAGMTSLVPGDTSGNLEDTQYIKVAPSA